MSESAQPGVEEFVTTIGDHAIVSQKGVIKEMDPVTALGRIAMGADRSIPFHVSSFWCGERGLGPRVEERVVVFFSRRSGKTTILEVRPAADAE